MSAATVADQPTEIVVNPLTSVYHGPLLAAFLRAINFLEPYALHRSVEDSFPMGDLPGWVVLVGEEPRILWFESTEVKLMILYAVREFDIQTASNVGGGYHAWIPNRGASVDDASMLVAIARLVIHAEDIAMTPHPIAPGVVRIDGAGGWKVVDA